MVNGIIASIPVFKQYDKKVSKYGVDVHCIDCGRRKTEQMVGGTVKFTMFIEYKCGAKTNGISKQDQISYQENNKKKKILYTQVNVQS